MNKINLLLLLYIKLVLSFNLYSIIYPIKHSFNNLDNKWNYYNKLFPNDNKAFYIGKWYCYKNINLLDTNKGLIINPEYEYENIILSKYINENNNIKSIKISNNIIEYIPSYYKKEKRLYDNNKQYNKIENINRIIKLKHTNYYNKLNKKTDILRTLVIRPNYCSITCTPYISCDSNINKIINNNYNLNNSNYTISFNIWLVDSYIYNNSIRTGIYVSYDGINGNMKEFILKKDNYINKEINIDNKIDIEDIYKSKNIIKYNLTNSNDNIIEFDNHTTINYIILKNNWKGNYRIHNLYNNSDDYQLTWSSDHNYFIPISNNEIYKYYQLKFKEGIYVNIPKNLKLFNDNENIYIEFVCFLKNGTGIQRFVAWGNKENGGIKTFCHDIWK